MSRTRERIRDFLEMGVPEVWIVDGETRSITVCTGATSVEHAEGSLAVPGTPVALQLEEVFSALDEYK